MLEEYLFFGGLVTGRFLDSKVEEPGLVMVMELELKLGML